MLHRKPQILAAPVVLGWLQHELADCPPARWQVANRAEYAEYGIGLRCVLAVDLQIAEGADRQIRGRA